MKAPVRGSYDNASSNHAPEKPGRLERGGKPDGAVPSVAVGPSPEMPAPSGQPWKRKTRRQAFSYDIATGGLGNRPTLVPDRIQEPESRGTAVRAFIGAPLTLAGVLVVAAAAVIGFRWGSARQPAPPSHQLAPVSDRIANRDVSSPDSQPAARPSTASDGAYKESADAAPATTVGVTLTPAAAPADSDDIAFLLKNGAELMAKADVAAARLMFRHAAEAGSAEAAFALAETYDPYVAKKQGRREAVTLDITLARSWYEKAKNLGSIAARERIVRLTQLPE